jgi:hypothetical protein
MRTILAIGLLLISSSASSAEKTISVPSDAKAQYSVLEIGGKWPKRTIVTKRFGPSGTSYSKRLYDCSNNTVKYLGNGDSLAEMGKSKPDPNMGPIVPQSIAYYVGQHACKR